MVKGKVRSVLSTVLGTALLVTFSLGGCGGRGNTEGEQTDSANGAGFVSDGGAGATLTIRLGSDSIGVGDTTSFFVTATDPAGAPLEFLRIFCESERGIAILEPSSGGVAFESTSSNGTMSGVLGGVVPGSYILECRGPQGSNLVDRIGMKITGSVPAGFTGFPGAAGGNLGGGLIVENPSAVGSGSVAVAGVSIGSGNVVDIDRATCDSDPEDFSFDSYSVSIRNGRTERITVRTVRFVIDDGRPASTSTFSGSTSINAGATGSVSGTFTEFVSGTSTKTFAGSQFVALLGTYPVTATVTGVTESGESFTATGGVSVTFGAVNNCD